MANYCQLADNLEQVLQDHFVCHLHQYGLHSSGMQKRLLVGTDDLPLKKTFGLQSTRKIYKGHAKRTAFLPVEKYLASCLEANHAIYRSGKGIVVQMIIAIFVITVGRGPINQSMEKN